MSLNVSCNSSAMPYLRHLQKQLTSKLRILSTCLFISGSSICLIEMANVRLTLAAAFLKHIWFGLLHLIQFTFNCKLYYLHIHKQFANILLTLKHRLRHCKSITISSRKFWTTLDSYHVKHNFSYFVFVIFVSVTVHKLVVVQFNNLLTNKSQVG